VTVIGWPFRSFTRVGVPQTTFQFAVTGWDSALVSEVWNTW